MSIASEYAERVKASLATDHGDEWEGRVTIECENTDNIVCPYCGKEDDSWWEYIGNRGDGDSGQITCGECEREISFTVHIQTSFSTHRLPCRNGEADHEWRARKGYDMYPKSRYCPVCGFDDWLGTAPNRHGEKKE